MFKSRFLFCFSMVCLFLMTATCFAEDVYRVLIVSTHEASEARTVVGNLRQKGYLPELVQEEGFQRVYVGSFKTEDDATTLRARAIQEGFSFAVVKKVDASSTATSKDSGSSKQVPDSVLNSDAWKSLTPEQKNAVMDIINKQTATTSGNSTAVEILELKKKMEALDSKVKGIVVDINDKRDAEATRQREVRRLNLQFGRQKDQKDYDGALRTLDEWEKISPSDPIVVSKRESINNLLGKKLDNEDVVVARERDQLQKNLEQAADQVKGSNLDDLRTARATLNAVLANKSTDKELKDKATALLTEVDKKMADIERVKADEDRRAKNKDQMLFWGIAAGVALLLVIFIVGIYIAGRRHYSRMMHQLQEEAIAPLQELRERTRMLAASGPSSLTYDEQRPLIEQSLSPDAEFLIPDAPASHGNMGGFDNFGEEPMFDEKNLIAPASSAKKTGADDGFAIDFGDNKKSAPAPQAQVHEDQNFSFDDAIVPDKPVNMTAPAITAMEIPMETEVPPAQEIVFSFDDAIVGEPLPPPVPVVLPPKAPVAAPKPVPAPAPVPKPEAPASNYQAIPLEGIDFTGGQPQAKAPAAAPSVPPMETNPLGGLSFNFDMDQTVPPTSTPPVPPTVVAPVPTPPPPAPVPVAKQEAIEEVVAAKPAPAAPAPVVEAPVPAPVPEIPAAALAVPENPAGIFFMQDYSKDPVGQMPKGWTGENNTYATLEVVSDPDNTSRKCMLFKKTSGDGPTGFTCAFPDVKGRLNIEFDFRCDEKNKPMLGFYFEKDADFRRSIHTVVQSAGPNTPSYLRVFTRPTNYQLRSWRHIRYIVDLPAGLVDGYVDGQLVAEGVRMGTLTDSLNTISIRDNSETIGSIYVANLVIGQAHGV
ncbi:TPA: hypothetical protein DDW35_04230 [Candidatus Sumerlaeota bacterium]|nr:hypothetical protein [Candidatus Sumerlaeota bacterium]